MAIELSDSTELLEETLEYLTSIQKENIDFARGIYSGINEKSQDVWQSCIENLLINKGLVSFYPSFLCTGRIQKTHLDKLLELIRNENISANSVNILAYGGVISTIKPTIIAEFCIKLSALEEKAAWTSMNIMFMRCYNDKTCIDKISDFLKKLVIAVPLYKNQEKTRSDIFQWHEMAKSLLKNPDQKFAIKITNQIIVTCKYEVNYGDLNDYIRPLLADLMRVYGEDLWPIFSKAIEDAEGMELHEIQSLLGRGISFSNQGSSVLSALPPDTVISWCSVNRDLGPSFVSNCINIFETVDRARQPSKLYP